jgi:dTDP-4-dehydrorhamnose reductase
MTNILVCGSDGQLGSELKAIELQYNNCNFIFTDYNTVDITDPESLNSAVDKHKPEWIINCAAYTAVDKAEEEVDNAFLINHTGTKNLGAISKKSGIKLIHVSTDYVFNGQGTEPYREDQDTDPVTVYGRSKLAGEQELEGNNNAMTIRTSWLYSSFGNNFVKTMLRLAKEKPELGVVNDQKGTPTYAADLAKAIIQIVSDCSTNKTNFVSGVYHYSNLGQCTWFDFASEILKIKGLSTPVKPVTSDHFVQAAKRPAYSIMDKSKIINTYNIEINQWEKSLKNCLELID